MGRGSLQRTIGWVLALALVLAAAPAHDAAAGKKGKAPALQPFVGGDSLKAPYISCIYYYSLQ